MVRVPSAEASSRLCQRESDVMMKAENPSSQQRVQGLIEGGQRLVHQDDARRHSRSARERDALLPS
jgi:hypothetical protein